MSQAMLEVLQLSHRYSEKLALSDVSLTLAKGECSALLGPNGSGKSTLLKLVSGLIDATLAGGRILYKGEPLLSFDPARRARSVAYIAPDLMVDFPLTVWELVLMGRISQGRGFFARPSEADLSGARQAMERCRCWGFRDRDVRTLSGGEKQLVALARALTQGADVLLLDEALSKMDLDHQALAGGLLRELGREGYACLLVSHDVNLASEWADRCVFLKAGEVIAEGPTRRTFNEENIRKLYPGAELVIGSNPATGMPKVFFS